MSIRSKSQLKKLIPGSLLAILGFSFFVHATDGIPTSGGQSSGQSVPSVLDAKTKKELVRKQKLEKNALEKKQSQEWSELRRAMRQKKKLWHEEERKKRHAFFAQAKGSEKREFMRDFKVRRDQLEKEIERELDAKRAEQAGLRKTLREQHEQEKQGLSSTAVPSESPRF